MVAVTATLASGRLTVTGTSAADLIYLDNVLVNDKLNAGVYDANGLVGAFPVSQIKSILIDAKGGNDQVQFTETFQLDNSIRPVPVSVFGNSGDDRVIAEGATLIDGGIGNDSLYGGGTLRGGRGHDFLDGYYNPDSGQAFDQTFYGDEGRDTISGTGGQDTIYGGADDDTINTSFAYETTSGRNALVEAGAGNDTVYIDSPGYFDLGDGDDLAVFGNKPFQPGFDGSKNYFVNVYGQAGNDTLKVLHKNTTANTIGVAFLGNGGNDTLDASAASRINIYASGDAGRDTLVGSNGNDEMYGGLDNDRLDGNAGDDTLGGDQGNDTLLGRAGNDTLIGDSDYFDYANGNDVLDGGSGNDTLSGNAGNDDLFGGDGNDVLNAGTGTNRLYGQGGKDTLNSKNGTVDKLYATTGDVLNKDGFDRLLA